MGSGASKKNDAEMAEKGKSTSNRALRLDSMDDGSIAHKDDIPSPELSPTNVLKKKQSKASKMDNFMSSILGAGPKKLQSKGDREKKYSPPQEYVV